MSKVEQIEEAIRSLEASDLASFRAWYAEFDAELWDRQLERDVRGGKLDALADEALDDLRQGSCTDL